MNMVKKLKWILSCFEGLSGMKINYCKNDSLSINFGDYLSTKYALIFVVNKYFAFQIFGGAFAL
jgi:hypothetical protein